MVQRVEMWKDSKGNVYETQEDAEFAEAYDLISKTVDTNTVIGDFLLDDFLHDLKTKPEVLDALIRVVRG